MEGARDSSTLIPILFEEVALGSVTPNGFFAPGESIFTRTVRVIPIGLSYNDFHFAGLVLAENMLPFEPSRYAVHP
jgi:hypothetical protein